MKTRKEAVQYARRIFDSGYRDELPKSELIRPVPDKKSWHWGQCEIAALMDFIYEGIPANQDEEIWPALHLKNKHRDYQYYRILPKNLKEQLREHFQKRQKNG